MNHSGFGFLLPAFGISLLLLVIGVYHPSPVILSFSLIFFMFSLFIVYFFRDPERITPNGDKLIVSAADGRVISIRPAGNMEFIGTDGTLVSIFMSVFDVHVNRIPVSGSVNYIKYNAGKFLPAFRDKASLENEQTEIGLQTAHGRIVMKQIAGIIARRIVCKIKSGDPVTTGMRFGMIKFGSRVDLYLPGNVEIKIKPNQKVKAGETIIGVFNR
jgi:phosphatidylserine decarboxylase